MGTPTQRARHDGESGLALAAVVAATRDHRMTFPIEARVRRVSPNLSVPELYEVRARGRDGRFEATSAACDLSYNPRTGRERLVVPPSTGQPGFTRERDWPWFSPTHRVLAMVTRMQLEDELYTLDAARVVRDASVTGPARPGPARMAVVLRPLGGLGRQRQPGGDAGGGREGHRPGVAVAARGVRPGRG